MIITLLRHGKPSVDLSGSIRADELKALAKAYEAAGIVDVPPAHVVDTVRGTTLVVCSNLPRSLESARALGFTEIHLSAPLFCETAMPHFQGGSIALPVAAWAVLLRILWLLGFSRNGESLKKARQRARQAASRLAELAVEHDQVLLVGHGLMNYLIARELKASGWAGPPRPGRNYWESAVYAMPLS